MCAINLASRVLQECLQCVTYFSSRTSFYMTHEGQPNSSNYTRVLLRTEWLNAWPIKKKEILCSCAGFHLFLSLHHIGADLLFSLAPSILCSAPTIGQCNMYPFILSPSDYISITICISSIIGHSFLCNSLIILTNSAPWNESLLRVPSNHIRFIPSS